MKKDFIEDRILDKGNFQDSFTGNLNNKRLGCSRREDEGKYICMGL